MKEIKRNLIVAFCFCLLTVTISQTVYATEIVQKVAQESISENNIQSLLPEDEAIEPENETDQTPEEQFHDLYLRLLETGDNSVQDISALNLPYETCRVIADDIKRNEGFIPFQCYNEYNFMEWDEAPYDRTTGITYFYKFHMGHQDSGFVERYAKVKGMIADVQSHFDDKMTDLDKLLWINEYIVEYTTYSDTDNVEEQLGGMTLVNGKGLCEGYAKAMMIFLKAENIPCKEVSGDAHEWVGVEIDGDWYHVDPTWDDSHKYRGGMHFFLMRNDDEYENKLYRLHKVSCVNDKSLKSDEVFSSSTKYENWYIHDIKTQMYYFDGYWYYIDNGSIARNNIDGTAYENVVSGNNLKIQSLENGVLKYDDNGKSCEKVLSVSAGKDDEPGGGQSDEPGSGQGDASESSGEQGNASSTSQFQAVTDIAISGISNKIAAGKKIQLQAVVAPENATNTSLKWISSNSKYAIVSETGVVTLKKAGIGKTVTITATSTDGSDVKATYKIKIMKHAVKRISIKTASRTLKAEKSLTLKTTVKTTGENVNKKLQWISSDPEYATVSKTGKVTAKKAGKGKTVTITAMSTDGSGKKASVKIKIK